MFEHAPARSSTHGSVAGVLAGEGLTAILEVTQNAVRQIVTSAFARGVAATHLEERGSCSDHDTAHVGDRLGGLGGLLDELDVERDQLGHLGREPRRSGLAVFTFGGSKGYCGSFSVKSHGLVEREGSVAELVLVLFGLLVGQPSATGCSVGHMHRLLDFFEIYERRMLPAQRRFNASAGLPDRPWPAASHDAVLGDDGGDLLPRPINPSSLSDLLGRK